MRLTAVVQAGLLTKLVGLRAHWQGPKPKAGEWLVPLAPRSRSVYEIVRVRPTRSARYPLRLMCRRHPLERLPTDVKMHEWVWDRPIRRQPLRSPLL